MGAFSGLSLPRRYPDIHRNRAYFKNQPSFELHDGFKLADLICAYESSVATNCDMVYVLNPRKGDGHTGLSTWYVGALIEQIEKHEYEPDNGTIL